MRKNELDVRHRALGSDLGGGAYNDMAVPWTYATDTFDEVAATRNRIGLFDVSAVHTACVSGPDAARVVDHLVSCDCLSMSPGTAQVGSELNDAGHIIDDIIVQRDAENVFRLCHGGGATPANLLASAEGRNVQVRWDDDLNILAVQGPRTREALQPHCSLDLSRLKWFDHAEAKLFGRDVRIFIGGFTGEYGVEIYCRSADALHIWDAIVDAGSPHGLMAGSWTALNALRIESGLLFYPLDMPEGDTTPWEVGMGWTISGNGEYRGKKAVLAAKGKERFKHGGIWVKHKAAVDPGAQILLNGQEVGIVTSPSYSQHLMQSIALAHLQPVAQPIGTAIQVRNPIGSLFDGNVVRCPFYDPMRIRVSGGN